MIDDATYKREISTILDHSGGSFYMVRSHHCRFLKGDGNAILVLAYLLNMLRMKDSCFEDRQKLQREDMWFRCPAKHIQEHLGMWDQKQRRAIDTLKEYGLVETSHRLNNVLWIRINTAKLKDTTLDTHQVEVTEPEKLKSLGDKVEVTEPEKLKPLVSTNNNTIKNPIVEGEPPPGELPLKKATLVLTPLTPTPTKDRSPIPDFCYKEADMLREFIKGTLRPARLDQETRENRAYAIFKILKNYNKRFGNVQKAEQRIIHIFSFYMEHCEDYKINLPRKPSSVQSLCKAINWLEEEYDKSKRKDDFDVL